MVTDGINSYSCIIYKNLSIFGNYYSERFRYITMTIKKCDNSSYTPSSSSQYCKTDDEINDYIYNSEITFNLVFMNTYFDGTDVTNPVKFFMDDTFYWPLMIS